MLIRVLAAGLFLSVAPMTAAMAQTAPAAAAPSFEAQHLMIPAPDGRTIDISVWTAPEERGVIVFSSGFNSAPAAYHRILSEWVGHGYTVVAPLHVDSLQHPEHDKYDKTQAFATRIMDVAVARGVARSIAPGKPLIAAGHSFGSLISAIEGGAVTVAGAHGDPEVKGVIEISSPGIIPGLVTPTTYATLDKPLLVITGDHDVVPGFAADWRDHRAAFDGSPAGDKTLLIFEGGDHQLIGRADDADFALIVAATEAFLDAFATGDAAAKATLASLSPSDLAAPDGVTIERR